MQDQTEMPGLRITEAQRQVLASLPESVEPIVVPDVHLFMGLSYYAEGRIRERLIYPVSRDLELRYTGSDTGSLVLFALGHHTSLHITGYDAVLAANPRFVLAVLPQDYLPAHLVQAGYRLAPIGASLAPALYEAVAPRTK